MPRVYELPTHLQVEDVLIAGLTARRLLRLMIGAALAYGLWDQALWLPDQIRLPVACGIALVGVAVALVQLHGRSLDQWLLAGLLFLLLPRRLVWRPGVQPRGPAASDQRGWAELAIRPGWASAGDVDDLKTESRRPRRLWWWGVS